MEIENVTRRAKPYPAYMRLETVQKELEDMKLDGFPHLFVIKKPKHVPELKQALIDTGWSIRQYPLQHERVLLYSTPKKL